MSLQTDVRLTLPVVSPVETTTETDVSLTVPVASSVGADSNSKKNGHFNFVSEMEDISSNGLVKAKDRVLAGRFQNYVNPGRIPDGHCASCAFNTHLHFVGQPLNEAVDPDNYREFGNWFYKKFAPRFEDHVIEPEESESYGSFRKRVATKVVELTKPFEAVLISVSDGAHWFNAYNDGRKIWFIDSQTGRPFNLYEKEDKQKSDIIECSAAINIITVSKQDVSDYDNVLPYIAAY